LNQRGQIGKALRLAVTVEQRRIFGHQPNNLFNNFLIVGPAGEQGLDTALGAEVVNQMRPVLRLPCFDDAFLNRQAACARMNDHPF